MLPLALTALTHVLSASEAVPIARVRLHPDEAWITRVGRLHLDNTGLHRLDIRDLPSGLRLEDLQVSARGPAGTRLGDVAVKADVRTVAETPEWKMLEAEKETLRDKQDALEAQRNALKQEETFLKSLQAAHAQELSARMAYALPQARTLAEFGEQLHGRLASLMLQEKRAQRDLDQLKLEQGLVQAEMDKRRGEQRIAPSLVSVELNAPAAGRVEVELSYRQTRARWRPVYEARLSEDRKSLNLVLTAAITQSTGERWDGVKLEISNARPSRGLALYSYDGAEVIAPFATEMNLRYGNKKGEVGRDNNRIAGNMLNQYVADSGVPAAVPPPPPPEAPKEVEAEESEATLASEASGLAATWVLEGAKEIPSDGEPHRFRVLSREIAPKLALLAVPRLTGDVQQIARFEAPANFPLFPRAAVTHYAGGQRLGESQLALPAAGQPFTFGFGPYKPLRVTFKKIDRKEESVGAFTKEHQWTLRDSMEVANESGEALEVEVQDRLLKSEIDTIKVKPLPDTTPGAVEKVPGVRTWTLSIPAKGKGAIIVANEVRSPLGLPLQGID